MKYFFAPVLLSAGSQTNGFVVLGVAVAVALVLLLIFKNKNSGGEVDSVQFEDPAPFVQPSVPAKPAARKAKAAAPAPVVEQDIPGEVVAVIAAAIAAMSGGKYVLRAVHRADRRTDAWARAGRTDATTPF